MGTDWQKMLLCYLHDPPDKALDIQGHLRRAARYATIALDREVTESELHHLLEDSRAAIADRLPLPTAGTKGARAVGPENDQLTISHPLSGTKHNLLMKNLSEREITREIHELIDGVHDAKARYLLLWRFLPEKLAGKYPGFSQIPADTRIPDHSIWNHLDMTTALQFPPEQTAFLSFSLGPVQPFIEAARSVRDLWSGSMILSWLTFKAMLPILEAYGPSTIIFPALRGVPLVDLWLKETLSQDHVAPERIPHPSSSSRPSPCIPNRFLAVLPYVSQTLSANTLAQQCVSSARNAWMEIAAAVYEKVTNQARKFYSGWDKRWLEQINNYFEFRTAVLPWKECRTDKDIIPLFGKDNLEELYPNVSAIRQLGKAIPHNDAPNYLEYSFNTIGQWQIRVDLLSRLAEAQRSIRTVPLHTVDGMVPPKCTIMGSYEQMGPDNLEESRSFWEKASTDEGIIINGVRLRAGERLCAISLIKRFSGPSYFTSKLWVETDGLRFADTATVAAHYWLKQTEIDYRKVGKHYGKPWNGQWLYGELNGVDDSESPPPELADKLRKNIENLGKPPTYYAILMMDGDEMGKWLRGENAPKLRQVLHEKMVKYFEALSGTDRGLNSNRPVSPALHAAISQALSNFSLHVAPHIVAKHGGTLIYAGGDDVLALLPLDHALTCTLDLRQAFSGHQENNNGAEAGYFRLEDGRDLLMMGSTASLSAGLVVVHHKEDLRSALRWARDAEKAAKIHGRNQLWITACRRSGEKSSALCPWTFVKQTEHWLDSFRQGASDRWAYHLRADLPHFNALPHEALGVEIERQLRRSEEITRKHLNPTDMKASFNHYRKLLLARDIPDECINEHFIILCQITSFMARGRDA